MVLPFKGPNTSRPFLWVQQIWVLGFPRSSPTECGQLPTPPHLTAKRTFRKLVLLLHQHVNYIQITGRDHWQVHPFKLERLQRDARGAEDKDTKWNNKNIDINTAHWRCHWRCSWDTSTVTGITTGSLSTKVIDSGDAVIPLNTKGIRKLILSEKAQQHTQSHFFFSSKNEADSMVWGSEIFTLKWVI